MFQSFRLAMAWVHTWFGLVLGFVLMATFFFGSLSVFDREIDRWSIPATRVTPQPMPSFDSMLRPIFEGMQPTQEAVEEIRDRVKGEMPAHFDTVNYWDAYTTHRDPVLSMYAGYELPDPKDPDELIYADRTIDPRTGTVLSADLLGLGSELFYPLHFSLTWEWLDLGYWLVGLAALVMLVALVSGVVVHRKLFREFFTFRPQKGTQRSTLDLHNLTGVVALPFHFFFAFTGLVIFAGIYFPIGHTQLEPLHDRHEQMEAQSGVLPAHRAGTAAPLASVDAMMAEAKRRWNARGMAGEIGQLSLIHVGDSNGYVSVYRAGTDRIALTSDGIHFRASTGEVLQEDEPVTAVGKIGEFLAGLHLQQFRHWTLRWLYFLGGLAGCVCIATGFFFFVTKRRRQHAIQSSQGARVVDALAVTTVTGMVIATLGVLIINRLLPDTVSDGWPDRGHLQYWGFWAVWLLAMAHAFWRTSNTALGSPLAPAWREQCRAIAVMCVAAVLLNWATTGDHLLRTLGNAYWPVAGVDLALLAGSVIALLAARRLGKARAAPTSSLPEDENHA